MPTEKKKAVVDSIKKLLENNDLIITDYRGLSVTQLREIRQKLREVSSEYKIVKNTLAKIAAKELDKENIFPYLEGPTAIAFSDTEVASVTKILSSYTKTLKTLTIKGGLIEGKVYDAKQVTALAALPPKEELLAKLLGTFQAPVAGFARIVASPVQSLVKVLDKIRENKEVAPA